jgi:hypothetical protein
MLRASLPLTLACTLAFAGATLGLGSAVSAKPVQEVAAELAAVMLPRDAYRQTIHQMAQGLIQGAQSSGQTLPPDFANKIEAVVAEAVPYDEQIRFTADVYAKRFSEAEINEMLRFYRTPTGTKLVKELPGITQDLGTKLGSLLPERLPQIMKKHGITP